MLPDLPWYGWIIIAGIITLAVYIKLPVYRNIFKKDKKKDNVQDEFDKG